MIDWLWWIGEGIAWMAAGACVLALTLCWLSMDADKEVRVWRADEEGRRWKR